MVEEDLLTVAQAAERLRCGLTKVYELLRAGVIPATMVPRGGGSAYSYRIRPCDLEPHVTAVESLAGLLSIGAAAARLRCTRNTVYHRISAGLLTTVPGRGKHRQLIPEESLQALLEAHPLRDRSRSQALAQTLRRNPKGRALLLTPRLPTAREKPRTQKG